jgi:hypothetical protein
MLLSMRPLSHETSAHVYVTLHGLHDLKGNKNRPKSLPAINQSPLTFRRQSVTGALPNANPAQSTHRAMRTRPPPKAPTPACTNG